MAVPSENMLARIDGQGTALSEDTGEPELTFDNATQTWDLVARRLQDFIDAWEAADTPPDLPRFLPDLPPTARRLLLIELIKLDLELRYQSDVEKRWLEDYLRSFPELCNESGMPAELIYEEYHVRKSAGEDVTPIEYYDRYPYRAAELQRLLPLEPTIQSSSLPRSAPANAYRPGDQLDDFELILQLGKGAFGTVFLARQTSMQRLVALKITDDRGSEPQTMAQLEHPHIVRVFDQHRLSERGLRLLYMQYAPGGTLQSVVERAKQSPHDRSGQILLDVIREETGRCGQLAVVDDATRRRLSDESWPHLVCRVGAQLAEALGYAHQKGILHRDVKPANVLLATDGSAQLADFNISFNSRVEGCTAAAYFGGSLAYMSPEQLEACNPESPRSPEDLDGRSDLYSLAVLLWELLCGRRPVKDLPISDSWTETLRGMVERRCRAIDDSNYPPTDRVDMRVRAVLRKCLSADPKQRHASGEELARDLRLCLHPRAARLLAPQTGWRAAVARAPLPAFLLAAVLPHVFAGVFNYAYNKRAIIDRLENSERAFFVTQLVINSIAYPLGICLAVMAFWPVARAMRKRKPGAGSDELRRPRRRALRLGEIAALIGIVLWCIAGVGYPVSLQAMLGDLQAYDFLHFAASSILCGLIAAAYPFLLVSFLSLRVFYPALLGDAGSHGQDNTALQTLGGRAGFYLFVAGGVPAMGTMALLTTGLSPDAPQSFALGVLSALGVLGFGVAFLLYRTLQRDIGALIIACGPSDLLAASSDSLPSI